MKGDPADARQALLGAREWRKYEMVQQIFEIRNKYKNWCETNMIAVKETNTGDGRRLPSAVFVKEEAQLMPSLRRRWWIGGSECTSVEPQKPQSD